MVCCVLRGGIFLITIIRVFRLVKDRPTVPLHNIESQNTIIWDNDVIKVRYAHIWGVIQQQQRFKIPGEDCEVEIDHELIGNNDHRQGNVPL